MAEFKEGNLLLDDDKGVYFGDNQEASISYDAENNELVFSAFRVKGIAPVFYTMRGVGTAAVTVASGVSTANILLCENTNVELPSRSYILVFTLHSEEFYPAVITKKTNTYFTIDFGHELAENVVVDFVYFFTEETGGDYQAIKHTLDGDYAWERDILNNTLDATFISIQKGFVNDVITYSPIIKGYAIAGYSGDNPLRESVLAENCGRNSEDNILLNIMEGNITETLLSVDTAYETGRTTFSGGTASGTITISGTYTTPIVLAQTYFADEMIYDSEMGGFQQFNTYFINIKKDISNNNIFVNFNGQIEEDLEVLYLVIEGA